MAGKSATLAIRIVSDAKGAARGFDEAASGVDKFKGGLDRASVAATAVVGAVGLVAKEAYAAASSLQQSTGAVESVFGAQAGAVKALAAEAAEAVGLSKNSYQELSSVLGAQLSGMGYAGKELINTNDELIRTGADLAATFGGSTADAVSAVSSLLRGERDPIEKYGIAMSQAAVDAQVLAMGLDTSTPAAKRAANAQATLALLTQQSAAAQGAFAREADTAAGSTAIASAQFEDAKAALGEVLLPVVAKGMGMLSRLAGWFVRNKDTILPLIGVVAGLSAAVLVVNGAFRAYTAVTRAASVVMGIFNAVMRMNPIGLVITALTLLVAGVVLAYQKFEWFRDFVKGVGEVLASAFDGVMAAIEWVIEKLSFVGDAVSAVGGLFSAPQTMTVTPVAGGSVAGLFGSDGLTPAPVFGASLSALSGGGPTAGQGAQLSTTTVHITINGAVDRMGTAREIRRLLEEEGALSGRTVTLVTRR